MEVEEELGICFSDLVECVSEFICNTSELGSESAKALASRGGNLLDVLENASSNIGKTNVQFDGEVDILKSLLELLDDADSEDLGGGFKFVMKMFRGKVEHFKRLVKTDWNQNCGKDKKPGLSEAGSSKKTPIKSDDGARDSRVVYHKVTPLKNKTEYVCTEDGCSKTTTNLTVLRRHMQDAHKKKLGPVDEVTVTCMLPSKKKSKTQEICNSKLPLSEMYRHLKVVHQQPRPSQDKYLRFFKSYDGGNTFTEAIYLRNSDPDPDEADSVKSVKTSKSVKRKLMDDNQNEDEDNLSSNETKSQNILGGASHNDTADSQNDPLVVDSSTAVAENSKIIDTNNSVEMNEDEIVSGGSIAAVLEPEKSKLDTNLSEDSSTVKAKPKIAETLNEEGSEVEPSKKKQKVDSGDDDLLQDAFCSDAEFLEKGLDLQQDSEIDDDDKEDFTKNRLDNKTKRYSKRMQPEIYKKEAWEEDDNFTIMQEFDDYLKTYKYATNANKDSSTYSFSLGHMFKYPDSYLNFHTKLDPDFNFKRVVSFTSPGYVELSEPLTWMNSIAGGGQENARRR